MELIQDLLANQLFFSIIMMAVGLGVIAGVAAPFAILAERKLSGWIQDRIGPNRVGPWGLLQPLADGIKFLMKEDFTPAHVDKPIFIMAPFISMIVALIGFAVIPWAGEIHFPWMAAGEVVRTQVANLNVGVLYMLSIASLGVYGVVLGAWASNNKYAFYGGIRATAQMISYEVPLGLGVLVVILIGGTLELDKIVYAQAQSGVWYILLHPVAFVLVLTAAFAETNRTPFDLAEAEQELVGGYHTEYSAMKFAAFFLAEYSHMATNSALVIVLFLGGWSPFPFFSTWSPEHTWWNVGFLAAVIKFGIFFGKIALFLGLYIVIRWTVPRFRFDQLMRLAWKSMVPLAIGALVLQVLMTALGFHLIPDRGFVGNLPTVLFALAGNAVLIGMALFVTARSKQEVTGRQDNMPHVTTTGY